jgi:hypothetical protein
MSSLFVALFALVASSFRTRAALQGEILALRHQLAVCQKNAPRRLRLHRCDRLLWVVLYRFWSGWRRCLEIVQPANLDANAVASSRFLRLFLLTNGTGTSEDFALQDRQVIGPISIAERLPAYATKIPYHIPLFVGKIRTDLMKSPLGARS